MTIKRLSTMRTALSSPEYLGGDDLLGGDTWMPWRPILIAALGEPLLPAERKLFTELTGGREREPGEPVEELWAICGRRAGKSRATATLAAYMASAFDFRGILAPGQVALVPVMAASREQASEVFNYLVG